MWSSCLGFSVLSMHLLKQVKIALLLILGLPGSYHCILQRAKHLPYYSSRHKLPTVINSSLKPNNFCTEVKTFKVNNKCYETHGRRQASCDIVFASQQRGLPLSTFLAHCRPRFTPRSSASLTSSSPTKVVIGERNP